MMQQGCHALGPHYQAGQAERGEDALVTGRQVSNYLAKDAMRWGHTTRLGRPSAMTMLSLVKVDR